MKWEKEKSPKAKFSRQILILGSNRAQRNTEKITLAAEHFLLQQNTRHHFLKNQGY